MTVHKLISKLVFYTRRLLLYKSQYFNDLWYEFHSRSKMNVKVDEQTTYESSGGLSALASRRFWFSCKVRPS